MNEIIERLKELKEDLIGDGYVKENYVIQEIEGITQEAINFVHSSTQLKTDARPTFEFWCDANGVVNSYDYYIYKGDQVSVEWLVDKYIRETN